MKAYKRLSSLVYQHDKPIGKSLGDLPFYASKLSNIKGKVLEPACGNGRIMVPLNEAGIDIEGFDLSDEMLSILKAHIEKEGLALNAWKDDMVTFSAPNTYEALIVPAGSFLLINNAADASEALKRFNEVMTEGGLLYIDIFLARDTAVGDTEVKSFQIDKTTTIRLTMEVIEYDDTENVFTSRHLYEKYENGKKTDTEEEIFPLKYYTLNTFQSLLEAAGFEVRHIHSDYNETFDKNASIYTFEAVKK